MDLDDGVMTGRTLKDSFYDQRQLVDVISLKEKDPKRGTVFTEAKIHLNSVTEKCKKGTYPFKALCVDSLTSLLDAAMRQVQGASNHIGQNPQLQEYGLAFNQVENFLTVMKALPLCVIVVAHQHYIEYDNKIDIRVAIPGRKLPGKICSWFDEIWRMQLKNLQKGEVDFLIQTKATASTLARSRFNIPNLQSAKKGLPEILKGIGYEF